MYVENKRTGCSLALLKAEEEDFLAEQLLVVELKYNLVTI